MSIRATRYSSTIGMNAGTQKRYTVQIVGRTRMRRCYHTATCRGHPSLPEFSLATRKHDVYTYNRQHEYRNTGTTPKPTGSFVVWSPGGPIDQALARACLTLGDICNEVQRLTYAPTRDSSNSPPRQPNLLSHKPRLTSCDGVLCALGFDVQS